MREIKSATVKQQIKSIVCKVQFNFFSGILIKFDSSNRAKLKSVHFYCKYFCIFYFFFRVWNHKTNKVTTQNGAQRWHSLVAHQQHWLYWRILLCNGGSIDIAARWFRQSITWVVFIFFHNYYYLSNRKKWDLLLKNLFFLHLWSLN